MTQTCPAIQSPAEERANCITHAAGALLSGIGLITLIVFAALRGDGMRFATAALFGACMLLLYTTSALFHAWPVGKVKHRLRILDHIAIYALIAGSYTPFLLVLVRGGWGWGLFAALWAIAAVGAVLKMFFVHRFDLASTIVYLIMGWIGVIGGGELFARLPGGAIAWILAGGIAYTAGAVFYLWETLPYNHTVWHVFVMAGSACHFLAVLLYTVMG